MSLLGLQYPPSKILITSVSKDKSRNETEKRPPFGILSVTQKIIYKKIDTVCTVRFHSIHSEDKETIGVSWPLI